MATINLPGLATGIDTTKLIQQLMAVESRRLRSFETRKDTWGRRKDALSELETKLSSLRT